MKTRCAALPAHSYRYYPLDSETRKGMERESGLREMVYIDIHGVLKTSKWRGEGGIGDFILVLTA